MKKDKPIWEKAVELGEKAGDDTWKDYPKNLSHKKCKWKINDDFNTWVMSECGKEYYMAHVSFSSFFKNYKYCPYCGKEIEIKESEG